MLINKFPNPYSKLFYMAHSLQKEGRINIEEKGRLKGLQIYKKKYYKP